jgi:hypothetical protein
MTDRADATTCAQIRGRHHPQPGCVELALTAASTVAGVAVLPYGTTSLTSLTDQSVNPS